MVQLVDAVAITTCCLALLLTYIPYLKCDQKEPACTQCSKKGIACPGYRNLVDLMFRDESSHVIKKVKSKRTQPRVPSRSNPAGQGLPTPSPSPLIPAEPIYSSPTLATDSISGGVLSSVLKVESPDKANDRRARNHAARCHRPVLSALNKD